MLRRCQLPWRGRHRRCRRRRSRAEGSTRKRWPRGAVPVAEPEQHPVVVQGGGYQRLGLVGVLDLPRRIKGVDNRPIVGNGLIRWSRKSCPKCASTSRRVAADDGDRVVKVLRDADQPDHYDPGYRVPHPSNCRPVSSRLDTVAEWAIRRRHHSTYGMCGWQLSRSAPVQHCDLPRTTEASWKGQRCVGRCCS